MTPEEAREEQEWIDKHRRYTSDSDLVPDDMRATIAALRWEYAIESQWSTGDWANTTGWFPTPERAQAELFLDDMPTRLIRRLVGNAEEAPK
ncbi:hypothetical protein AALF15_01235 [Corynebacteriaceae bacterium 7-707]